LQPDVHCSVPFAVGGRCLSEPLLKRNVVVCGALFAAAFATTLLYTSGAGGLLGKATEALHHVSASPAPRIAVSPQSPAAVATPVPVAASVASAAVPTPREPTATEMQAFTRLQEQARSDEAEERGDALRRLAVIPGPQVVQALGQSLREDADIRNRLIAVTSLQRLGEQFGDAQWLIRDALRIAADDRDEVLSLQAQAAHEALLKKLGAQR
jgi:hypothetical protein